MSRESLFISRISQWGWDLLEESLNGTVAKKVLHSDLNSSQRVFIGILGLNRSINVLLKYEMIFPIWLKLVGFGISFSHDEYNWVLKQEMILS